MIKGLKGFWSQRYRAMGHTGWSDPIIYSYDQIERLANVESVIENLNIKPNHIFDFGCGTGDFSRMLLNKGFKVYGYDPHVNPRLLNPKFFYIEQHDQIDDFIKEPVGLILSVTVLDHILDDEEFYDELVYLRTKIAKTGFLLCLEYALDEGAIQKKSSYQAFRTMDQWKTHLAISGWQIFNVIPIAHPSTAPSIGFSNYQKSILILLLKMIAQRRHFRKTLLPILKYKAQSVFQHYGIGNIEKSPLKLIICKPEAI